MVRMRDRDLSKAQQDLFYGKVRETVARCREEEKKTKDSKTPKASAKRRKRIAEIEDEIRLGKEALDPWESEDYD